MIKAVIFDMDGIIFDTESISFKLTKKLFKEYGKSLEYKDIIPYLGIGSKNYVQRLARKKGIKESVDVLMEKRRIAFLKSVKKIKVFKGIVDLIKDLRKKNMKIALATSSSYETVKHNMKSGKVDIKLFDLVITREYITKFKPDPEEFEITIKNLKLKPEECVIIEDSPAGVLAGKRAGANVIAITNSVDASKLGKADLIVNSAKKIKLNSFPF